MADNVLKPLMLGRGVDAPMPVILLGALGGMAAAGILGMFVGATRLALGDQIFMGWVPPSPSCTRGSGSGRREAPSAGSTHRRLAALAEVARSGAALALLAPLSRAACATAGPDFHASRRRRGSSAWSAEASQSAAAEPEGSLTRRPPCSSTSGGATSATLVLENAGRGGPAPEPRRAHRGPAHPRGARDARNRRQRPVPCSCSSSRGERPVGRDEAERRSRLWTAWTASAVARRRLGAGLLGKFRRGIEAADAGYLASIAQYDDLQVLVAAQAASFYATIRTLEQRLRIAHENAALQKRSLEITERLFRSGNESELDLQQARTLYLSTLATIPELEASLRQAQNALAILLARPPGPLPELDGRPGADPRGGPRDHRGDSRPTCCAAGPTCARPELQTGRAVGAASG